MRKSDDLRTTPYPSQAFMMIRSSSSARTTAALPTVTKVPTRTTFHCGGVKTQSGKGAPGSLVLFQARESRRVALHCLRRCMHQTGCQRWSQWLQGNHGKTLFQRMSQNTFTGMVWTSGNSFLAKRQSRRASGCCWKPTQKAIRTRCMATRSSSVT